FLQLESCSPRDVPCNSPRPGVRARIVDDGFVVKRLFADACEFFDNVEKVCVRMSPEVEPGSFVETNTVDDERVSLPTTDRVAHPTLAIDRIVWRVRAAIHKNLAPDVRAAFIDDENAFLFRHLKDLRRERRSHRARAAGRKTEALGVVLAL